jgi:hypothetical protein
MQSMLKQKPTDDPHDILVVAPDAVRVAPLDDAPPAHDAARPAAEPLIPAGSIFSPGAAVPPVDTTFRPTAVDDVLLSGGRRSIGQRALRAVTALLLTACISGAAIAWHSYGGAAQQMIAEWAPLFAQKSSQPSEKTGLPAQPALAAAESATRPAAQAPAAAEGAAPVAPDEAPSLETMARDLANAGQEIEALTRIDHPGVVGVFDVGEMSNGKPYFVMQYVEGKSLRASQPAEKCSHVAALRNSVHAIKTRSGWTCRVKLAARMKRQVVCRDGRLKRRKHKNFPARTDFENCSAAIADI